MKIIVNCLLKLSEILKYIAYEIRDFREPIPEYYVYIPTREKPRYRHPSFRGAKREAKRLAKKCTECESIEVLKVEYRIWGDNPDEIPF